MFNGNKLDSVFVWVLSSSIMLFSVIGIYFLFNPIDVLPPSSQVSTVLSTNDIVTSPNRIIEDFLTSYYEAYETTVTPDFSEWVEINEETILFVSQLNYRLAMFKAFGDQYSNIDIDFAYYNTRFAPTEMTTSVYVTVTSHYNRDPSDIKNQMGTWIDITLVPQNASWVISSLVPNDVEYNLLESSISTEILHTTPHSYVNAVNNYITERIDDLTIQRQQWDDYINNYAPTPEEHFHNQIIRPHRLLVSYDNSAAAEYVRTFGSVRENNIFKRMENDCTNFVNQGIWAGYGGTDEARLYETEKLRLRVANNFRMIDFPGTTDDWWGINSQSTYIYPSTTFMRVTELWDFATASKSYGPNGFGYNNNQYYYELEDTVINYGDVLQFYSYEKHRYSHSVMVVSPETELYSPNSLWNIRVAQHTSDFSSRPLHQLIALFGEGDDTPCKMRLLKLMPANFID